MHAALNPSTGVIPATEPKTSRITAVQDRDCIDRAKFRYNLGEPLPAVFFDQFSDSTLTIREFSKTVPFGRDLFSIVKPGIFRADGLLRDSKMIVAFHGDARNWPLEALEDFERRLNAAGYGKIRYIAGTEPKCVDCPARFDKKCAASRTHPTL